MEFTTSIIIPTYNERENIASLVSRIDGAMRGYKYQIVIVDDDSKDGTADVAKSLAPMYPVKVLVRQNKKGLATAILDGIQYTDGQVIGVMDADLQHPPEALPDLIKGITSGNDMVIASRYVPGGGCENWSLSRRIISKGAIALSHIFLPGTRKVSDPVSGFFMFRRELIRNAKLDPTGYKIMLEILVMAQPKSVAEVPFTFVTRKMGKSKLSFKQERDYLTHLLSLMRRTGELARFIKFCLVGASGVLVNVGIYWLLTRVFGLFAGYLYLLSSAISFEASVVSNFTLNDFFTFRDMRAMGAKHLGTRLLKFNLVSLLGLAVQQSTLWLFKEVLGLHDILALIIGIALATVWNYLVNTWWTWK